MADGCLQKLRLIVQTVWTVLCNSSLSGFSAGRISSGWLKNVCVPGLNCYSCPGALGACPVGSFQAFLAGMEPKFPLYVSGLLLSFGALWGRAVCGWLCPFGLVQDGLYAVPVPKKLNVLPGEPFLRKLKYAVLILFVIVLPLCLRDPLLNVSDSWFCKYLCPAGTLMGGWPLAAADGVLRAAVGALFGWKSLLAASVLVLSLCVPRPFCRYLCPLGAFYGVFNRIALFRLTVDLDKCVRCGMCTAHCPQCVDIPFSPDSAECIRCGKCAGVCPTRAIHMSMQKKDPQKGCLGR